MSRYDGKKIALNNEQMYQNAFKKRGVNYIRHYLTPKFKYPSAEDMEGVEEIGHIWGVGDKLWKLASQYYNDPKYWYVIAFWNQTNEMFIKNGDVIYVPTPLSVVLDIIEV